MADVQRKIEEYIRLFAKYPTNREAEEKFLDYQLALAKLCELLDQYDPAPKLGNAPELTGDDVLLLRESYSKAMAAGKNVQQFLAGNGEANSEIARARNKLIDSVHTLLDSDFTALSHTNVLDTEGMTLPEMLERSRGYQVDITGQNISKSGANMSSRIPVSFEDKNGKKITGFFTENTVTNQNGEFQALYEKAIQGHPEFDRAIRGLMGNRYFLRCFSDLSNANTYLQQALEKEDLNHAFDDYLWKLLPDRPGNQKDQAKKDEEELGAYISSITKDNTFAKRMADFCKGYAGITNKYGLLKGSAEIEDGSNLDERNAAMSSVGDLLGVPDLLARSVKMELIDNGIHKKGVFMEFAPGSDLTHQKKDDPVGRVTQEGLNNPDAFKSIADLQVLDYVCGNIDRHIGNMFYKFEETEQGPKFTGIVGIDNDCSFGKVRSTRYNDVQNMVGTNSMLAISESMALKIASMTREMLEVTLKNYALSREEVQMAWERVESVKAAIDEGVEFYEKNPDVGVQKGHLRIVRDDEWKNLSLRDLALPADAEAERENSYGNYFSKVYFLPQNAADIKKEKEDIKKAQETIWEKHPELRGEELPFTIARGTKVEELNAAGIAENGRNLHELQAEMKRVNSGFFVGSSQFDHVIKAYKQVKELSEQATPNMSAQEIKNLHDAYKNLDKVTQIYLEKKETERVAKAKKGKELSDVAKARTSFAQKLQRFTKTREQALSREYMNLEELYKNGVSMIGKKNATAKQVAGAATVLLAGYALRDSGTLCTRSEFKEAMNRVKTTPGFDSFMKNTAQIKNIFSSEAAGQAKNDPVRVLQNKLWNHARLTLRENGPMEKPKEPVKPAGPVI